MLIAGTGLLRADIGRNGVCDDISPISAGRSSCALKSSLAVFREDYLSSFLTSQLGNNMAHCGADLCWRYFRIDQPYDEFDEPACLRSRRSRVFRLVVRIMGRLFSGDLLIKAAQAL